MFSRHKKCTLPEASPATIVVLSGATAQQKIELSPMKVAMTSPSLREAAPMERNA
ncbi:hypothetical protein [Nostoc sp. ChiQUE01b]|uniref:hypothetical protein n=1 Tax=Nostoc sp. ChiQUE01b TaxID=3075376 RepID=UPI002AD33EE5|nr:hypothetical protein [Nostoc sp. ChiQUE01b]